MAVDMFETNEINNMNINKCRHFDTDVVTSKWKTVEYGP